MASWLAKITLDDGDGVLILSPSYEWTLQASEVGGGEWALSLAQLITIGYEYSPGDGIPGVQLAEKVIKHLGGSLSVPEQQALPEGAVN